MKVCRVVAWIALTAIFSLTGCDDAVVYDGPTSSSEFRTGQRSSKATLAGFGTCENVHEYVVDRYADRVVEQYAHQTYYPPVYEFGDVSSSPTEEDGGQDSADAPAEYTETNIQVDGVEEADIMKTNGTHVFFVQGSTLRVMKSYPPEEASLLTERTIPGYSAKMFLRDDRLTVLSQEYHSLYYPVMMLDSGCTSPSGSDDGAVDPATPEEVGCDQESSELVLGQGPITHVTTFDIGDPSNPTEVASVEIQGSLIDTRRIDESIYLVLNRHITWDHKVAQAVTFTEAQIARMKDLEDEEDGRKRAKVLDQIKREIRPQVAKLLKGKDLSQHFKTFYRSAGGNPQLAVGCNRLMRPSIDSSGMGYVSVLAFDIHAPTSLKGVSLVSSGWHVYASQQALYVARDSRGWDWFASEEPTAQTNIHKFILDDEDVMYAASGSVEGFVKDRYSFSEHRGFLRVATTDRMTRWWGGAVVVDVAAPTTDQEEPTGNAPDAATDGSTAEPAPDVDVLSKQATPDVQANNLFVLKENGNTLEVTGELHGYGKDERIYAVRYMGDKVYIVTFRQTDPLYTIDVSDPENPTIAGELKITGFSNYLHPIGDDYLIGLGREASTDGVVTGLQVQLFDVSDDSDPVRTSQYVLDFGDGWASSSADHDPHAFVWYSRRNLLAIPLTVNNWSVSEHSTFAGLQLFHITPENGITPAGRISHSSLVDDTYCSGNGPSYGESCVGQYAYNAQMLRSIFMGSPEEEGQTEDYIYALSAIGMSASNVNTPADFLSVIHF